MEDEKKSLMFENLLSGMADEEREALLDFLLSLSENNWAMPTVSKIKSRENE